MFIESANILLYNYRQIKSWIYLHNFKHTVQQANIQGVQRNFIFQMLKTWQYFKKISTCKNYLKFLLTILYGVRYLIMVKKLRFHGCLKISTKSKITLQNILRSRHFKWSVGEWRKFWIDLCNGVIFGLGLKKTTKRKKLYNENQKEMLKDTLKV